jgi:D-glycero-D-manno-heptose 1,7-bisphosphate phosphatase
MELTGVHTVGDSLRDLQAGAAAGCTPHLVYTGKGQKLRGQTLPADFPQDTRVHDDLAAFVDWLLVQPEIKAHAANKSPYSKGASA